MKYRNKYARGDSPRDAEEFFGLQRAKSERKTQQLCRQVFRTLTIALAGECGDPILQDLCVDSVTPAPDATRLLVSVICPNRPEFVAMDVLLRLQKVQGLLRHAVATDIVRKRAPELAFHVIQAGEVTQ
jgi:ribosome-binding factor A